MKSVNINTLSVITLVLLSSCTRMEFVSLEEQIRKEYLIAVVLPMSDGKEQMWHRSIDWALENLNKTLIPERGIRIKTEWYDEDVEDIDSLFSILSGRKDICAIIGPLYSKDADIAARHCARSHKVLMPALSTSARLMRAYAGDGFLWCLAENDISQCEVLLSRALHKGAKSVSLLSSDDAYGQTFVDWFAFQSKELGLEVKSIEIYTDTENDVESKLQNMLCSDADCIICIPKDDDVTARMNAVRISSQLYKPFLLFSDGAFLKTPDDTYEGMEGIVLTYDPTTGFHINFEARYGIVPQFGNAHFYDAVILAGLGILIADINGSSDIAEAISDLVSMQGTEINNCSEENICIIVKSILSGKQFHMAGASGGLYFSSEHYTNVLHSVYCHWIVYQGKHLILEYNTSDSGNRTDASAANWNWRIKYKQDFSLTDNFDYGQLKDLYAIIVATSSGWENYRHQANAFAMYQLLKGYGMNDDHIIMVAEDDIAYNEANPDKGSIKLTDNGENLYSKDAIDYTLSSTSWSTFSDRILDNTNSPLASDSLSNIILYWSGHGSKDGLNWLDTNVEAKIFADLFKELSQSNRFRKALLLIEACYSGNIGIHCQDIPGLLCITAANELETSKADRYSPFYGTWMSNCFTESLLDGFTHNPYSTFYELYTELYNRTVGSHVSVYNASLFDNLYYSEISEFLFSSPNP